MQLAGIDRLPIESHVLQAFVSESLKPFVDMRRHLRRRPSLHVAVRQGRPGLRRRHRRLQQLRPARQSAGRGGGDERDGGDVPGPAAGPAAALLGRHHGHVDGRLADHHHRAAARHVSQLRLVLRRLQGDAGFGLVPSPGRSPRTSRTRSTRPTRSTASTAASSSTRRARARRPGCTEERQASRC